MNIYLVNINMTWNYFRLIYENISAKSTPPEGPQTGGEARPRRGSTPPVSNSSEEQQSFPSSPRQSGIEAKPEGEPTSACSTPSEGPQNGEEARSGEESSEQSTAASDRVLAEVLGMLESLGLVEYEEVFMQQELSLAKIAEMNHEDLQSIGISLVKHRKAIIKYCAGRIKRKIKDIFP